MQVEHSFFNLRYPFWHDHGLVIRDSEMTELCRAALWYSGHITIENTKLHGIKALRECSDIIMRGCDIISPEFGWSVHNIEMEDCDAESEYFMMRSANLHFSNVRMKGKYSFQYIENSVFENCTFDTKDAFWHAKNITVRNSVVKGEYLAWYCENVTFENCKIIGTQPLCYCKGLKLINCEMEGCDLAFDEAKWKQRSPRRLSASKTRSTAAGSLFRLWARLSEILKKEPEPCRHSRGPIPPALAHKQIKGRPCGLPLSVIRRSNMEFGSESRSPDGAWIFCSRLLLCLCGSFRANTYLGFSASLASRDYGFWRGAGFSDGP